MDKESALEKILDIVDTVYEIIDPDLKRAARAELEYLHSVNRETYLHNHAYMALTPPAPCCNMLSIPRPFNPPPPSEPQNDRS